MEKTTSTLEDRLLSDRLKQKRNYETHRKRSWVILDIEDGEIGVHHKSRHEDYGLGKLILFTPDYSVLSDLDINRDAIKIKSIKNKILYSRGKALEKARLICKTFNENNIKP